MSRRNESIPPSADEIELMEYEDNYMTEEEVFWCISQQDKEIKILNSKVKYLEDEINKLKNSIKEK